MVNHPKNIARIFVQNRRRGRHAMLTSGASPPWLNSFRNSLSVVYADCPFSQSIMNGMVDTLSEVFLFEPREPVDCRNHVMDKLSNVDSVDIELTSVISKIDAMYTQDIRVLPDYLKWSRLYCRIYCVDTLDPVREAAMSLLLTLKRTKRGMLFSLARHTGDLETALGFHRRACVEGEFVRENSDVVARREFPPSVVAKPTPQGMSSTLRHAFANAVST